MTKNLATTGLIAAQREIIAYWHKARGERPMPLKSDINPGALRMHLSSISMIEIDQVGEARFRIAGTRLCNMLGGEMSGRALRELERDKAAMWSTGLVEAIERGAPAAGIVERRFDRHAWLRLPIEPGLSVARLVLCHDVLLPRETTDTPETSGTPSYINRGIAA